MASASFPDVWTWLYNLPPITQWRADSMSTPICSSASCQPSLKLSIYRNLQSFTLSFSILADYNLPISLWTSKSLKFDPKFAKLSDEETISSLLANFIDHVLSYSPNRNASLFKLPKIDSIPNLEAIFNLSFLTLTFIICIYEAPADLRPSCLNNLKNQLACPRSREVSKHLMRLLGSNTEEEWMRSLNLAITNWIIELKATNHTLKKPSPLFSYAISAFGLWKVQLYCPIIAMDTQDLSNPSADERLLFSLNYHQLEGVIQLNYKVEIRERWIEVMVNTDNIRCNVIRLVTEALMKERGAGICEKHFPSRISLQLTPILQTNILSISVGKSTDNPTRGIEIERSLEGSFQPPNPYIALKVSAGETMTMELKPWKFEQSVLGDTANLNWYLHDSMDGMEVFSSKPSKFALLQPKSWFKNRYSNPYRPFTRQGGVIFAGDQYGDRVWWKVDKGELGKSMEWELKGWIWLTYWPNKHKTFYTESRRLEFREILHLTLA